MGNQKLPNRAKQLKRSEYHQHAIVEAKRRNKPREKDGGNEITVVHRIGRRHKTEKREDTYHCGELRTPGLVKQKLRKVLVDGSSTSNEGELKKHIRIG